MDKKVTQFNDTEIEKYKFHEHRCPILINNIGINKKVVSNKVSFGKKDFKYFINYKDPKKLDLYANSYQKSVYIEEIFIKLNLCIFYER